MTTTPKTCDQPGCDTRLVFARRQTDQRWFPFEATDRPPFSEPGLWVLIERQAWRPLDLIEDRMVAREMSETAARELVSGYPFHRIHFHDPAPRVDGQLVVAAIARQRFAYADEVGLQDGLTEAFAAADLPMRREVALTPRDRIDLMVARVGVEVKVAGSAETVTRQLARYAASPVVDELVLVTTRAAHRSVPTTVGGKPVTVHLIRGSAW